MAIKIIIIIIIIIIQQYNAIHVVRAVSSEIFGGKCIITIEYRDGTFKQQCN